MNRQQRVKLHFGPYKTPRFKYGSMVMDESRGEVRIVGLSNARIPWPIGKRGRSKSLVLYKGLARAVRMESGKAIMHWWGVSTVPVIRWRKALNVELNNAGTIRLRQANAQMPWVKRGLRKAWAMADDPKRRANLAAMRVGKPMPRKVIEGFRKARSGKPLSAAHRRKISDAQKRRGGPWIPERPWARWEDALLMLPIRDIVERTGRTRYSIHARRRMVLQRSAGKK